MSTRRRLSVAMAFGVVMFALMYRFVSGLVPIWLDVCIVAACGIFLLLIHFDSKDPQ